MGWLEGVLSGYAQRNREIAQENLQQQQLAMEREGKAYEALLNSPDEWIRTAAGVGLMNAAAPLRRKSGLAGFLGQMEQDPIWPVMQKYMTTPQLRTRQVLDDPTAADTSGQTPSASPTPTTPGAPPVIPKQGATTLPGMPSFGAGSLAQSANQTTKAGSPPPTPPQPMATTLPTPTPPAPNRANPFAGVNFASSAPADTGAGNFQSTATADASIASQPSMGGAFGPPPPPPAGALASAAQRAAAGAPGGPGAGPHYHTESYYELPHAFPSSIDVAVAQKVAQERAEYEGYRQIFAQAGSKNPDQDAMNLYRMSKIRGMQGSVSPADMVASSMGYPSARLVPPERIPELQRGIEEYTGTLRGVGAFGAAGGKYAFEKTQVHPEDVDAAANAIVGDATMVGPWFSGRSQAFKDAVGHYIAQHGGNIQKFSESTRAAAELANDILPQMDTIAGDAEALAKDNLLGPIEGRWNDFLTGTIGADGFGARTPQQAFLFARFKSEMDLLRSAVAKAHMGMRGAGSPAVLEHMDDILNGGKMGIGSLLGAMSGMRQWMAGYAHHLPMFGNPWGTPGVEPEDLDPQVRADLAAQQQQQPQAPQQAQTTTQGPPQPPPAVTASPTTPQAAPPGAGPWQYDPKTKQFVVR